MNKYDHFMIQPKQTLSGVSEIHKVESLLSHFDTFSWLSSLCLPNQVYFPKTCELEYIESSDVGL